MLTSYHGVRTFTDGRAPGAMRATPTRKTLENRRAYSAIGVEGETDSTSAPALWSIDRIVRKTPAVRHGAPSRLAGRTCGTVAVRAIKSHTSLNVRLPA